MSTVRNEYKDHESAPDTDFLLVIASTDSTGVSRMMRVIGITKQAVKSLDKQRIPLVETTTDIHEILSAYFTESHSRFMKMIDTLHSKQFPSKLIH